MDQVHDAFMQLIPAYSNHSSEFFTYTLNGKFPTFRNFIEDKGSIYMMAVIRAIENPSEFNITLSMFRDLMKTSVHLEMFYNIDQAALKEGIDYITIDEFKNKHIQLQRISKKVLSINRHGYEEHSFDIKDDIREIDFSTLWCWNGIRKFVEYMATTSMPSLSCFDFYMKSIEESYLKLKEIDDFNRSKIAKAISKEKFAELNFDLKEEHDGLEKKVDELKNTINDLKANYAMKADERSLDNKRIEGMINDLEAKRIEDKKHIEGMINDLETERLADKKYLEDMTSKLKDTVNVPEAKDISLKCDQDSIRSMVIIICEKVKFIITRDLYSILSDLDSRIKSDTYDVSFYETFDEAKEEAGDNISGVVVIENIKNDFVRAMKFFKCRS